MSGSSGRYRPVNFSSSPSSCGAGISSSSADAAPPPAFPFGCPSSFREKTDFLRKQTELHLKTIFNMTELILNHMLYLNKPVHLDATTWSICFRLQHIFHSVFLIMQLISISIILTTYTEVQKFGAGFNDFERSPFCSPRLHLFDQKYSKN